MFSNSPLFIIKSKTAKDSEKFVKFGLEDLSQNEKEVLFKSGSRFKVYEGQVAILLEEVLKEGFS